MKYGSFIYYIHVYNTVPVCITSATDLNNDLGESVALPCCIVTAFNDRLKDLQRLVIFVAHILRWRKIYNVARRTCVI